MKYQENFVSFKEILCRYFFCLSQTVNFITDHASDLLCQKLLLIQDITVRISKNSLALSSHSTYNFPKSQDFILIFL